MFLSPVYVHLSEHVVIQTLFFCVCSFLAKKSSRKFTNRICLFINSIGKIYAKDTMHNFMLCGKKFGILSGEKNNCHCQKERFLNYILVIFSKLSSIIISSIQFWFLKTPFFCRQILTFFPSAVLIYRFYKKIRMSFISLLSHCTPEGWYYTLLLVVVRPSLCLSVC